MASSRNRQFALALGLIWIGFGIVASVFSVEGSLFGIFSVNPLQSVVHIVVGAGLLTASFARTTVARRVNLAVGILALALGIVGVFTAGNSYNVLALNGAGLIVLFGSSALLLIASLSLDRRTN